MQTNCPEQRRSAKFSVPILRGILSTLAPGFSVDEIQHFSQLTWHLALLEKETEVMEHYVELTFTKHTEENHEIILQNYAVAEGGFRERLGLALDNLRLTIPLLKRKRWLK